MRILSGKYNGSQQFPTQHLSIPRCCEEKKHSLTHRSWGEAYWPQNFFLSKPRTLGFWIVRFAVSSLTDKPAARLKEDVELVRRRGKWEGKISVERKVQQMSGRDHKRHRFFSGLNKETVPIPKCHWCVLSKCWCELQGAIFAEHRWCWLSHSPVNQCQKN